MIGIIVIYSVVFIATISMGYHLHRCIKDKRIAEDNSDKAALNGYDNGYEDGYKIGFAAGEKQGFNDGKLFSEIAAHNEKVLRKQGIIK